MRDFVREPQWRQQVGERDLRASAARGFHSCSARAAAFGLPTSNWTPSCALSASGLAIYHLARCGPFFQITTTSSIRWRGIGNEPLEHRKGLPSDRR